MKITRAIIKNFRNFEELDVQLGRNTILLGENGVGKTNFLEALRLVLDPSRERRLYREDFHRPGQPFNGNKIEVHLYFADFQDDQVLHGKVFPNCIIEPNPPIAQVSYIYCPKENIPDQSADGRDDYRAIIYGRGDMSNNVRREIHAHLNIRVIPALRNIDKDIAIWQNSPLRRWANLKSLSDNYDFIQVSASVRRATQELQRIDPIKELQDDIKQRLTDMVESVFTFDPQVGMLPSEPEALQRALRLFLDENLSLDRSSLGLANVLYLTLLMLEIEQRKQQIAEDEDQGEKYQFTILAVEEPEAHLHPHLQRLVFHDFLRWDPPVFLSTHSPQIVSVAEADSLVVLKKQQEDKTIATSTANLSQLPEWEPDWEAAKLDLERYLDSTRGEVVFAKGVILVEGDAELFLVPAFAKKLAEPIINIRREEKQARILEDVTERNQRLDEISENITQLINTGHIPCTLDGAGISVCSVAGTDFKPYVRFLGPEGLNLPLVVITDGDKYIELKDKVKKLIKPESEISQADKEELIDLRETKQWDVLRQKLERLGQGVYAGLERGVQLAHFIAPDNVANLDAAFSEARWDDVRQSLSQIGIFVNDWTLEADLAYSYQDELVTVYGELGASSTKQENMREQLIAGTSESIDKIITRIEETGKGKGRFAQRLSSKVQADRIPEYIHFAIRDIVQKTVPMLFQSSSEDNGEG
jgi:putative ATP-dependent endonuclease of the OLD family